MLAPALVLDGASRADAAQAAGLDRQALRERVYRSNGQSLVGLSDRHGDVGPERLLSLGQEAAVRTTSLSSRCSRDASCGS